MDQTLNGIFAMGLAFGTLGLIAMIAIAISLADLVRDQRSGLKAQEHYLCAIYSELNQLRSNGTHIFGDMEVNLDWQTKDFLTQLEQTRATQDEYTKQAHAQTIATALREKG